jgi:cysteine-rich repeat protein
MRWLGALVVVLMLCPATAMAQSFNILWYDHGEELIEAGSLREHLTKAGHRVTYLLDSADNVDLSNPAYADIDVVVAQHTAGAGTLVNVETWLRAGKGYVAMIGPQMYTGDSDAWIRGWLDVNDNGEPLFEDPPVVNNWNAVSCFWSAEFHQIARWPNAESRTFDITSIVASNERSIARPFADGAIVIQAGDTSVLAADDHAFGIASGRVAIFGTYFTGADRSNAHTRQLIENIVVWAAGPYCGNAIFDVDAEECDDGNLTADDGCSPTCTEEHGFTCDEAEPSNCFSECADGMVAADEGCDDGGGEEGDGCDGACEIETGSSCSGEPSVCRTGCSNGLINDSEECDDGANANGDGCSRVCTVEPGYSCAGAPSVCTPACGNGVVAGSEECDDGNNDDGDGCASTCQVERGYACAGAPSSCASGCGDGFVSGPEACDDGAFDDSDGCSHNCRVEHGFYCAGNPSVCTSECGDGMIASDEVCDDSNATADDGCNVDCSSIETGFTCAGEPSVCSAGCGDGAVASTEICDDGNNDPSDGCAANCTVEHGFTCSGSPSVCSTTCGDGLIAGSETCDDANVNPNDGCSAGCTVEIGFTCAPGEPSVCQTNCGDGAIAAGIETCDDGNDNPGDGCSATCQVENGYECTPGAPSVCSTVCGNGIITNDEYCDDGNTEDQDGCPGDCGVAISGIENGWTCNGEPSACTSTCGDGLVAVGAEQCDDANTEPDDGCGPDCSRDDHTHCEGEPSVCCYDGDYNHQCDPPLESCACRAAGARSNSVVGGLSMLTMLLALGWLGFRRRI